MPRNTRAAARAQEDIDIATDDTQTEARIQNAGLELEAERPALVELTANAIDEIELVMEMKGDDKATKKGRGTTKKGTKKNKVPKKPKKTATSAASEESTDDVSSGSEVALESENSIEVAQHLNTPKLSNAEQPILSKAETITQAPSSPEDEEAVHEPQTEAVQKLESLFLQPSEQPTPIPGKDVSAVASSSSESMSPKEPKKPSPKEEKSKIADKKSKSTSITTAKATTVKTKDARATAASKPRSAQTVKARPSVGPKPSRSSTLKARPSTLSPIKTRSPKTTASPEKKRSTIAALNTPPKPIKSNKPLTTSTFKLPGEALQERFKAQREERQKRQEEQAQKQKESAVRPTIPPKHTTRPRAVPEVKTTKASAARMSMSGTLRERPNGLKAPAGQRAATMKAAHRPSLSVSSGNTVKAPRPQPHARSVSASTKPEITQPTVTMTAAQKAEAAKKARAEAAERGRAASKAWAEKRQKELETKKATTKAGNDIEAKENTCPTSAAVEVA